MDEPTGERPTSEVEAAESEEKVYSQRQWDLEHEKWLCRAWHISAWPFGVFIFSWLFSDSKPIELLLVGLGGLAVLWGPAAYHWYRYSNGTGKWIWI